MNHLTFIVAGFVGGIAVAGFLFERRYRKLEREIQQHVGTEDKLRRYGA